ncbi:GMC oxidoreductase-domain-containing protein, partial [Lobosporangium transversale]
AGCVVASRLAEDPKVNVLVLEAGYSDEIPSSRAPLLSMFNIDSSKDWRYRTVPQVHANGRILKQPRGKIFGGSSSINAMMYVRGAHSDYDEWESLGNPGWSYGECLPYFKKPEGFNDPNLPSSPRQGSTYEAYEPTYHGTEGPWQVGFQYTHKFTEKFIEANVAEGVPFNKDCNGHTNLGVTLIQRFVQRDGVRSSLARAFLKGKNIVPGGGERGRIRVVYGANISRILTQTRKGVKTAYGVEFLDHRNVQRRVLATKEVLLCAGAFGSPHLLLASGIGPSRQPSIPHVHTLPGVGANLEDHIRMEIVFRASTVHDTGMNIYNLLPTVLNYKLRGAGVLSSNGIEGAAFLRLEDIVPDFVEREKANGTYKERASGPDAPHVEIIVYPFDFEAHGEKMALHPEEYYSLVVSLLHPCSSGTVTIRPKMQKSGSSAVEWETVIDPNYFSDPFDLRVVAETIKFIRKLGRRLSQDPEVGGQEVFPGEEAVPDHDDAKLQDFVRQNCNTIYHPTGTCRMGPASDPLAVVDHRLNVHGVENLRVIDASVMPKIPGCHTCAPTVMIAEKGSDFI